MIELTSLLTVDIGQMNFEPLLPSADDAVVLHNMATLIGRILCKNMPEFSTGLGWHIQQEHYEGMCSKSEVVSCV